MLICFNLLLACSLWFHVSHAAVSHSGEVVPVRNFTNCGKSEYFNVYRLRCLQCDGKLNLQPSPNRTSCVCNDRSKIKRWDGGPIPECILCGDDEVPTLDQRDCITCPVENVVSTENSSYCDNFLCPKGFLSAERNASGHLLSRLHCVECPNGTQPNLQTNQCEPCLSPYCCDEESVCPPLSVLNWPADSAAFTVNLLSGHKVISTYLKNNLRRSIYLCRKNNQEACQSLANMCVLMLYDDSFPNSPCALFREYKRIPAAPRNLAVPWIYYGEGDAPSVLSRRRIQTHYCLDDHSPWGWLNFTASVFALDGRYLGLRHLTGREMQLCPGNWNDLDRSMSFLTSYRYSCRLPAKQMFSGRETEFFDLHLSYQEGEESYFHAVPILIRNLPPAPFENSQADRSQWQLVRRWFLVDNNTLDGHIRYARRIVVNVRLQGRSEEGRIHVPFFAIEYSEMSNEQLSRNEPVEFEFQVVYEMQTNFAHATEVCMGVLSALAVVWAAIRTWSHSKRNGRLGIDLFTLFHLILFTCGNLANVFFFIVFCASVNVFAFFKGQTAIHVLLPTPAHESTILVYICVAFGLKIVEIVYLVYSQVTLDIFFVDWERPRANTAIPRAAPPGAETDEHPVSIWRTYFVANEWNEIQTKRKINNNLHLLITLLVLQVANVGHWASSEPRLHSDSRDHLGVPTSRTCSFAVGGLVYITVYFAQWLFITAMYERYIKNGIHEFVDMCSMANISVFILSTERYGYYIHGRSAHGFADTDMLTIVQQLRREEEDLVGHRGLIPGTDQQTFEMTVPATLRAYYAKVMMPLNALSRGVRRPGKSQLGKENCERSVQAYHNMNRFLGAFLDHALKDLDYEVREKMFTESLFGIEFRSDSDKGVLYTDNGHSFDQVLFYGNEFTLLTFDLILFSFVEMLSQSFLLAGAITALVAHTLAKIRRFGGRLNLAKKTLTDERFLI